MGFPKDFFWGAASAAHQVEGAYLEDGKGLGIWDALAGGRVAHNENGNTACDHYHHYKEDVALMKDLGLKHYRFSVSWPRVMPDGTGRVNEKGLDFYRALVDELGAAGIEPMVTLFHWNLPYALHQQGGWKNPAIIEWFAGYVEVVTRALSGRVRYWMTLNEPQCFAGLGYEVGEHAPFQQEPESLPAVTRNVLLAHGRAVQEIRRNAQQTPHIGMAPTGSLYMPRDESPAAVEEARQLCFSALGGSFSIAWWCDAPYLGSFPEDVCRRLGVKELFSPGELAQIHQPLDFFGFNLYHAVGLPVPGSAYDSTRYQGSPRTSMDWPVVPEALYWGAKFLTERYKLPLLITENGMGSNDWVMLDGQVHDPQRIDYLHRYLRELRRAVDAGFPVMGYTYWSIMDNFEWAKGYDQRFGLVYVDYRTQKRTCKDSYYWYRDLIASNGANLL
ncbi:MAG: beta-glucosidase [Treponema sp.]|jgi:beta-glucosidase|nr:beta-glucosidase [Treponema sp.]